MYKVVLVLRLQCSKCHYFKGLIISLFCQTFTRRAWHYFHSFTPTCLIVPATFCSSASLCFLLKVTLFFGQHGRLSRTSSHQTLVMIDCHVEKGPNRWSKCPASSPSLSSTCMYERSDNTTPGGSRRGCVTGDSPGLTTSTTTTTSSQFTKGCRHILWRQFCAINRWHPGWIQQWQMC